MIGTLSFQASKELLSTNVVGRIGCYDGTRTYVVPVQYVFDGKSVFAHSVEGMKIHIMRKNPGVCFEVDEIYNLNNWKSAIVWGQYNELVTEHDRYATIKLFVEHDVKLKISETSLTTATFMERYYPYYPISIRPVIYRILVEEITGRFEKTD